MKMIEKKKNEIQLEGIKIRYFYELMILLFFNQYKQINDLFLMKKID